MSWRERRRNNLFLSPALRSPDPNDLPWHCQADRRRERFIHCSLRPSIASASIGAVCTFFGAMSAACRRIIRRAITAWFRKRCCRESTFRRRIFTAWWAKRTARSGERVRRGIAQLLCFGAGPSSTNYPAARVSPSDGQLSWLITADAVGNLPIR